MSLKQAYSLAHTAQCRLQLEVGRPDRNLRFIVGHLMHYESLRLRIVEIEHDISQGAKASAVSFKGTGHISHELPRKPSTGQLGRFRSPPPPVVAANADDDEDSSDSDVDTDDSIDDDEDEGLGLMRFPSGSAQPPRAPPDLEPDEAVGDDQDEDEPVSPEDVDSRTIDLYMQGQGNKDLTRVYNQIRKCSCHGKAGDVPVIERMWELPPDHASEDNGILTQRAIAQVA